MITLAFASNYDHGAATVLSYAYLFASYLVAATGFALGMSRIADMRRGALADWREVIADTVPAGFRYSMLLVAPALAALVAGGATLIGEVLPKSFSAADVSQLRSFSALLGAWTVAALLVNLLLPALFALGRSKLVNLLAPVIVVLHIAVTALGGVLFGAEGVVGAFFVVPLAFAAVLLFAGAGRESGPIAQELAKDGLRFALLAAVSFGIGAAVGDTLASGIAAPLLTLAIGSLLYAAGWAAPGRQPGAAAARRRAARVGMNVAVRSEPARRKLGRAARRPGASHRRQRRRPRDRRPDDRSSPCWPRSAGAPGACPRSTPATSSTSPAMLASGGQPYSDIRYFYGPAGLYALGGAFAVFGASFTTAFAFGLLQAAAIIAAFYALARQLLRVAAGRPSRPPWWPRSASPAPPSTSSSPTPTPPPSASSSCC